jgi:branched-chain amino acid transport system permease protein
VFLVMQDVLAKQFPEYWYFGIGLLLVLVVMFAPGGILGLIDKWLPFSRPAGSARTSAR